MHQLKYELELLNRFEIINFKYAITPPKINHKLDSDVEGDDVDVTIFKQLAGLLRYLCNTRPEICYVVRIMSMFMHKPKWSHYQAAVRILRHILRGL